MRHQILHLNHDRILKIQRRSSIERYFSVIVFASLINFLENVIERCEEIIIRLSWHKMKILMLKLF